MKRLFFVLLSLLSLAAHADLKVFATVPEWGALAKEIGGKHVDVFTATGGLQDPHHVEAKPSLIARARNADLIAATGAELEVGWLPVVLRDSGNPHVQPGQPGNFEAARYVHMLEVPTRLDRADGDVHAGGNPHIQTDPRNFLKVGEALAGRMAQLDAANAAEYQANFKSFAERWKAAIAKWEASATPLRGMHVVTQHKAFPYLYDWLGIVEVGTLEPKPGVEPSVSYLSQVVADVETRKPRMAIRAAWNSPRPTEWFSEHAHLPAVALPFTVGGSDRAKDLFGLFDDTVAQLLKAVK
ncbi:Zinc ABC transporter substrate-binding protein [Georgfuchsia toluolica]|uniref:Zinc ABC transporter substrate-binding protein n=1 Tax=Georgfuchsia toluolica TaxID=424218 RepID=A0A916N9Y5_9PROT|nr:zinc ABC transporter substrate-binding protein [Georgfuchsia toluolica]CAG4885239.1 Zinc ABC transporter substrate-binding protein [Georgfuchsia toluolica]